MTMRNQTDKKRTVFIIDDEPAISDSLSALASILGLAAEAFSTATDFLGFANPMIEGCQKIADAVDAEDFEAYELALTQVTQACTKCHSVYR